MCVSTAGYWNIIVHGRKHSYHLYTKALNEAMRWVSTTQGVIDNKPLIETPTQQLIRDIKVKMQILAQKRFDLVLDVLDVCHSCRRTA